MRNEHESIIKAELPTMISEEVETSGALIGHLWRLACEKVIKDSQVSVKVKTVDKYMELWLTSQDVCGQVDPNYRVVEVIKTYHEACRDYLGTLDIQQRRLGHLTVTRPLRPNKICKISAPRPWKKNPRRRLNINCKTLPPFIVDAKNPCVMCGHCISTFENSLVSLCRDCNRPVHNACCDKQFLVRKYFRCRNIECHLGENATTLPVDMTIPPKPIREDEKCLICGDPCYHNDTGRLECRADSKCTYGVHEICAAMLAKINGKSLYSNTFCCSDVNYYLKPQEVHNLTLNKDETWIEIKKVLAKRKQINPKMYTPKKRRYENPDAICDRCGERIGINEEDHALAYCRARLAGTPVPSRDFAYGNVKLRRLRSLALHDYPP